MTTTEHNSTTRTLVPTRYSGLSPAEICRRNGWGPGTRLVGDEGYGPTVIEITAVGRDSILAIRTSHNSAPITRCTETTWTLACRVWTEVDGPS